MSKNSEVKIGYISRGLEAKIEKYLPLPQIIAVVGPRRSGKTTLLQHLKESLDGSFYLSFEDKEALDLFERDIKTFARLYLEPNRYLFLDEFHYAKHGGENLKYLFDYHPGKKIVISGSSAADLTIKAINHLVGRVVILTLYPFSFGEFLEAKDKEVKRIWESTPASRLAESPIKAQIERLFKEYLVFGGYPEVVLQPEIEIKKTLLKNIYNVLFLREVRDFIALADDYKLRNLIRALALQIGNLVNYQELGQAANLDYKTLKRYLGFLEKVFICRLTPPFFTNKRKELVKVPKVYFYDTGLINAVTNDFSSLEKKPNAGAVLENTIFDILVRGETEVKFWRTKAGAEVDFVLEPGGRTVPIEVKLNIKEMRIPLPLRRFIENYHPEEAFVVTQSSWGQQSVNKTTVTFQPVWELEKTSLTSS